MSILFENTVKCCACGKESDQETVSSAVGNSIYHLDTRSRILLRSSITLKIQECPHCGYVAFFIDSKREWENFTNDKKFVNLPFISKDAWRFYKKYCHSEGLDSLYALVFCIWVCDDAEDYVNAYKLRKLAVEEACQFDDEYIRLIKADFLRRTGQFERLIGEYSNFKSEKELHTRIIDFQIKKALENDRGLYTVDNLD